MSKPNEQEMRDAVTSRDRKYDGAFFYGVVTTGVFCRPSCPSRQALPANLRFFFDTGSALAAGFRPCQRCKPLETVSDLEPLVSIARYIDSHSEERLTLDALSRKADMTPAQLRRRFMATFGVSPKTFHNAMRMRRFKSGLRSGASIVDAMYSAGFGSSSRLYGNRLQELGMTPKAYQTGGRHEQLVYACRNTVLGFLMIAASERGICFCQFGDNQTELRGHLQTEFPQATLVESAATDSVPMDDWIEAIDTYLNMAAPMPELPLDLRGTAFQIRVWRFLLSVPDGEVITYGEVAEQMGIPRAARGVASACAANRIGLLVPCHRVIRADGRLGGYRWGMERKAALIKAERKS